MSFKDAYSPSIPSGFRFNPTDEDLLIFYLWPKVHGKDLPMENLILEVDVYGQEPWLLPREENPYMRGTERYYFVKRQKLCSNGKGKRPRRTLEGNVGGGWWRSGDKDKPIPKKGPPLGYKKTLTFYSYKNKKKNRKEAQKSEWIMHEYRLAMDTFQECVLCRIYYREKSKKRPQTPLFKSLDTANHSGTSTQTNLKDNDLNENLEQTAELSEEASVNKSSEEEGSSVGQKLAEETVIFTGEDNEYSETLMALLNPAEAPSLSL